jgi:2-dehydro-3-deoxygluconokinase
MTVFIFGEAMLENPTSGDQSPLVYGGDTLNTAIHMARMGVDVAYVTAIGTDKASDVLVKSWADEGINVAYVLRHPTRTIGKYWIDLDPSGERHFRYDRDQSAARAMFDLPQIAQALDAAKYADMLYLSHITLAILPDQGRNHLLDLARDLKSMGRSVAYDSNFRPALWASFETARTWSLCAIEQATIGLPTNSDEADMHETALSIGDIAVAWTELGCPTVIVKAGAEGCYVQQIQGELTHFPATSAQVVDSSGAGDAFNGGFLSGQSMGMSLTGAIAQGQALARWVIGQCGAIPRPDAAEFDVNYPKTAPIVKVNG